MRSNDAAPRSYERDAPSPPDASKKQKAQPRGGAFCKTDIRRNLDAQAPRAQDQDAWRLSAAFLPVRLSLTISYVTFWPSSRPESPERWTAEICTNTSAPPSSG